MCGECLFASPLCVAAHDVVSKAAEPKSLRVHFQGAKKKSGDINTAPCYPGRFTSLSCS